MKVRIKFSKHGVMKFIGHLDIMRYFQKAIRRSDIDIAYSTGFSPHQIMSFAMPLSVGLESNGEYFDIEMNSLVSCQDVKNRLEAQMVDGIHILNVILLPENAGNAMASVAAAKYTITFRDESRIPVDLKKKMEAFYEMPSIPIMKQSKKSSREVDLKPGIFELTATDNSITLIVDASSSGNIKPALLMAAFYQLQGLTLGEFDLLICREETYRNAGNEEKPVLVPLDEVNS